MTEKKYDLGREVYDRCLLKRDGEGTEMRSSFSSCSTRVRGHQTKLEGSPFKMIRSSSSQKSNRSVELMLEETAAH